MTRSILPILALLIMLPVSAPAADREPVDREQSLQLLETLLVDLDGLEELAEQTKNTKLRHKLIKRIQATRDHIRSLHGFVIRAPGAEAATAKSQEGAKGQALGRRAFGQLLKELKGEGFPEAKIAAIRRVTKDHRVTSAQVVAVVDTLAFSEDKVKAAAAMFSSVSDPKNFGSVYAKLPFDADRARLRQLVGPTP